LTRLRTRVGLDQACVAVFALAAIACAAMILYFTRRTTLWFDDWNWALYRRGGLHSLLEDYNSHLSFVPILIYRALFAVEGIGSYLPFRIVLAAGALVCGGLVFEYSRRRVGNYLGLLAALLILFLGPGWQDLLWPFQIGWLVAIAAGIGALLMLDRRDRVGDVTACLLFCVSVASSSVGVAVLAGAVAEIAWGRRAWRDWWIPGIPIALYAIWSLVYQHGLITASDVFLVPGWIASSAAASVSVPLGLSGVSVLDSTGTIPAFGFPLALAGLAVVIYRGVRLGGLPRRAVSLGAIALAFWVLTAIGRGFISSPYPSRYVYVDTIFVLLFAVELARGVRVRLTGGIVLALVCAFALLSNIGVMRVAGGYLRAQAPVTRASVTALDIARDFARPGEVYTAFAYHPFVELRVGAYFAMQRAIGSPVYTPARLAAAPEAARVVADAGLVELHAVALVPVSAASKPCLSFTPPAVEPAGGTAQYTFPLPPAGVVINSTSAVTIALRRFATAFAPLATVRPGASARLAIAPDRAPQPWHVQLAGDGVIRVCGA
jgi:hypothetical protein